MQALEPELKGTNALQQAGAAVVLADAGVKLDVADEAVSASEVADRAGADDCGCAIHLG